MTSNLMLANSYLALPPRPVHHVAHTTLYALAPLTYKVRAEREDGVLALTFV